MLLHRIEKFLSETGMPWTKFGRIVAHDPRLVGDMRNGRQPRPELAARIQAFIQPTRRIPMRFDFRTTSDTNAERVALFSPAARLGAHRRTRLAAPSAPSFGATAGSGDATGRRTWRVDQPCRAPLGQRDLPGFAPHDHAAVQRGRGVAAASFIALLPDHEFTIRHQLVADAAVSEVTHVTLPVERMVIEADAAAGRQLSPRLSRR
jgi:hypothetical protein